MDQNNPALKHLSKSAAPILGFLLIFAYWWSVHPLGFSMGYSEDFCPDILRQLMAENLDKFGKPTFHSDAFMAPSGTSMPYMSWTIERDWIGAYFWKYFPSVPYMWFYYGVSLFISYISSGLILKKMRLSSTAAWLLATAAVLFHIPRHFKTWHHLEHLPQHWLYLSLFVDAWIWQKFTRDKKWSVQLEAWRGVVALGVFLSTGYYWGAMIMEWAIVRGCLLGGLAYRKKKGIQTEIELDFKKLILPTLVGLLFFAFEVRWFSQLYKEIENTGKVWNNLGWFAAFYLPFRPLWFDRFFQVQLPFYGTSETVTCIGWVWVIPLFLAFWALRKRVGGAGIKSILPFLIFLVIADFWQTRIFSLKIIGWIQGMVPFLSFFRVATRWSLLFPELIAVILALSWPELKLYFGSRIQKKRVYQVLAFTFILSSAIEMSWLLLPVNMLPPLPADLTRLLKEIDHYPGDTVLDLPFCVAGGNGYCSAAQCPNYPASTTGQCFRLWHDKKIYGMYAARMAPKDCEVYNRWPYLSWFSAWQQQRCFTDYEWKDFCEYLGQHPEISAILMYPDIWVGANQPACLAQFDEHLGPKVNQVTMPYSPSFGGKWTHSTRVNLYRARCIR